MALDRNQHRHTTPDERPHTPTTSPTARPRLEATPQPQDDRINTSRSAAGCTANKQGFKWIHVLFFLDQMNNETEVARHRSMDLCPWSSAAQASSTEASVTALPNTRSCRYAARLALFARPLKLAISSCWSSSVHAFGGGFSFAGSSSPSIRREGIRLEIWSSVRI